MRLAILGGLRLFCVFSSGSLLLLLASFCCTSVCDMIAAYKRETEGLEGGWQ